MEYLTLNNGTRMPLVGFGTFMPGGEACTNAVAAAIRGGYRMIALFLPPTHHTPCSEKAASGAAKAAPLRLYLIFPI